MTAARSSRPARSSWRPTGVQPPASGQETSPHRFSIIWPEASPRWPSGRRRNGGSRGWRSLAAWPITRRSGRRSSVRFVLPGLRWLSTGSTRSGTGASASGRWYTEGAWRSRVLRRGITGRNHCFYSRSVPGGGTFPVRLPLPGGSVRGVRKEGSSPGRVPSSKEYRFRRAIP